MKPIPDRLPSQQLDDDLAYFKRCVEDYQKLVDAIERVLENKSELFTQHPLIAEMKTSRFKSELNVLEGMIRVQTINVQIYERRVEEYAPIFARETEETNKNWDALFEEASIIARKFPVSNVAALCNGYPKEQFNPELFSQELKNETYKAIKHQVDSYHKQLKEGKGKNKEPNAPVRQ